MTHLCSPTKSDPHWPLLDLVARAMAWEDAIPGGGGILALAKRTDDGAHSALSVYWSFQTGRSGALFVSAEGFHPSVLAGVFSLPKKSPHFGGVGCGHL
jgi:hypothetical protein